MFGHPDPAWQADVARVGEKRAFLKEQSLWAIWVYRFGRRLDQRPAGLGKQLRLMVYWFLFRIVETVTGISLPKSCTIGKGLRIWHFGGVFINEKAILGEGCTLRHGVTIGNRIGEAAPTLGDNVELGAYAQVLGDIRIGNRCRIGALTLVMRDMPDDSVAVGTPARVLSKSEVSPSHSEVSNGFDGPKML